MSYNNKELIFQLKNMLIYASNEDLIKIYNTEEKYNLFVGLTYLLIEDEAIFLAYFTPAIEDISKLINEKRFEFHTTGNIRDMENTIIYKLNQIRNNTNDEIKEKYREIQESSRTYSFEDDKELLRAIAYDTHVITAIKDNSLDTLDKDMSIASILYLIDDYPEFFIKNKEYMSRINNYLQKIKEQEDNKCLNKRIKVIKREFKRYKRKSI